MNNDYIDKEQPQKKQTKKYLTTLNHFIKVISILSQLHFEVLDITLWFLDSLERKAKNII